MKVHYEDILTVQTRSEETPAVHWAYRQKPKSFANECEYRVAVVSDTPGGGFLGLDFDFGHPFEFTEILPPSD